jgi:hypothetical protein
LGVVPSGNSRKRQFLDAGVSEKAPPIAKAMRICTVTAHAGHVELAKVSGEHRSDLKISYMSLSNKHL